MIHIGTAQSDQLHASGRRGFETVTEHVKQLRAQGMDDAQIVGHMVADIGTLLLSKLGDENDAFWDECWKVCAALAFAATEVQDDKS